MRKTTHHPSAIQAIIFDLDGVLIDSEWLSFEEWKKLAREYGGVLDDSVFAELVGTTQEESAAIVMRSARIEFRVEETCALAWRRVIERLREKVDPLPGAEALVRALAHRGYPLAIASNSLAEYIETALQGLDLAAYFPVWVSRDQVAEGKPAPDVYLRAAERLGIPPEHCLAIEDSRVGVQSAASAGMRVIAVPGERGYPEGFESAWRVYPSLCQVSENIEELLV